MQISVVISLYNKEKYISRTIDSVLNQTIKPSEVIIVDDGSTDDGGNIVTQYSSPLIRLIKQTNKGEGAARNRGIKEATYEMIAFLDADDEWKPEFLEQIHRLYNNFPDCGAYATAYEILNPGRKVTYPELTEIPPAPWIGIYPNLIKQMQRQTPFNSSSIAIPKTILTEMKGFPEGVKLGADRMLWINLTIRYPIAFSPKRLAIYHFDAENRALNTHPLENELQIVTMVDQLIQSDETPIALLNDLKDLSAALKIQRAKLLIRGGKSAAGRNLLRSIGKNSKYSKIRNLWLILSYLPNEIKKTILKV